MEGDKNWDTFIPMELEKHSRPSPQDKPTEFIAYKINANLCPELHLYLQQSEWTSTIDITEKIFVIRTYWKPIKEGKKDTLSRWVKETMKNASVNVNIFKPCNCGSASSSASKNADIEA